MSVDKRIPVSEELWKTLGQMKRAGQTYDELLRELLKQANRENLADRMDEVRDLPEDELTPLEEA
jgi:predicted CopG family antitoxin